MPGPAAALCAGFKQGSEPLPTPPVTKSVEDFRKGGMSDTDMLEAALAWAHKQKLTEGAPAGGSA
jgi:activating signal cointegrator complex subunit 1